MGDSSRDGPVPDTGLGWRIAGRALVYLGLINIQAVAGALAIHFLGADRLFVGYIQGAVALVAMRLTFPSMFVGVLK